MEPGPEVIRSITHDMRNLLTAVRGHAELALRGLPEDDPVREDVAHCVVVTAAVFDLVDQLDGSDSAPSGVAVNLDSTVGAMRRLLDALLPGSIEMHLAPDAEGAFVAITKLRIERIVLNLALNARDAMDDGGLLSITTEQAGEMARIVVSDTGSGFTEDALEHLFEAGFTTKAERGGSGHGLSALARFVDGAGGSVQVDSTRGEGSTITVSLPLAELIDHDSDDLAAFTPPAESDAAAPGPTAERQVGSAGTGEVAATADADDPGGAAPDELATAAERD
jgi:signal transduction histidine kinase